MGTKTTLAVGGIIIWLLLREAQPASAQGVPQAGDIIINEDTGTTYVLGDDGKIHEVLDVRALSLDNIAGNTFRFTTEQISQFEEGGPIFCA